jgi:hypothetical protein
MRHRTRFALCLAVVALVCGSACDDATAPPQNLPVDLTFVDSTTAIGWPATMDANGGVWLAVRGHADTGCGIITTPIATRQGSTVQLVLGVTVIPLPCVVTAFRNNAPFLVRIAGLAPGTYTPVVRIDQAAPVTLPAVTVQ